MMPNSVISLFFSSASQAQRVCTIRDSRGHDEMAACGQLGRLEEEDPLLPHEASSLAR